MIRFFTVTFTLLLSGACAFETLNVGNISVQNLALSDKKLALSGKNELFFIDLKNKSIVKKYQSRILSINFKNGKLIILFNNLNKIFNDTGEIFTFKNSIKPTLNLLSFQNIDDFYLFSNGRNLLKFDSNFKNFKKITLNNSVKIKSAFTLNDKIYISFFDRNLVLFDKNLNFLKQDKKPFLITAFANLKGEILMGDNKGFVIAKKNKKKISNLQIDALLCCQNKIFIGDWGGNLYAYSDDLQNQIYKKQIFNDRVMALFCNQNEDLIAISWNGKIAIFNLKERELS